MTDTKFAMKNFKFLFFQIHVCLFMILFSFALFAKEDDEKPVPYQIPQIIYIGDNGRLVYPLDDFFYNQGDVAIPLDDIPHSDEIVLHRIELSKGRLIIDFQAYKTGQLILPPIPVAGKLLDGLEVVVSSLIEGKDAAVLSPAAAPMNAPGTFWIITTMAAVLVVILGIVLFFSLRGGDFFIRLRQTIQKRRSVNLLQRALKKGKLQLEKRNIGTVELLSAISAELRLFLDNYCSINCRSLVPVEFLHITFPENSIPEDKYPPEFFFHFFTRCDTLRFSGGQIADKTVTDIIDQIETFVWHIKSNLRKT